jgi:hypothetical protein
VFENHYCVYNSSSSNINSNNLHIYWQQHQIAPNTYALKFNNTKEYLHCACIARGPKSIALKNMVSIMLLGLMLDPKLKAGNEQRFNEEWTWTMRRNSWPHLTLIYMVERAACPAQIDSCYTRPIRDQSW